MVNIGIVVICTNDYFILGLRFIKQFMHYYIGNKTITFYIFTDIDPGPYLKGIDNYVYFYQTHKTWTDGTNSKFANILSLNNYECDYIYYFDADTKITKNFDDNWFLGYIVGGVHYNNFDCLKTNKFPYERRSESKAYVPINTSLPCTYYYGAFFGGVKSELLKIVNIWKSNQDADRLINLEPVWNDESYLNCYFHFNPPSKIVSNADFQFDVSCKGGLNARNGNVANLINNIKSRIIENPMCCFNLNEGKLVFSKFVKTTYDFIDKLVYINLDKNIDRKILIEKELRFFGDDIKMRVSGVFNKVGEVGRYKSHIEVIKLAIKNNWRNVLILEDDAVWNKIHDGMITLKNLVKSKYDVILLGSIGDVDINYKITNGIKPTGYIINNQYYGTLLENLEIGVKAFLKQNCPENVMFKRWLALQEKDNWFCIKPDLLYERPGYSDTMKEFRDYSKSYNVVYEPNKLLNTFPDLSVAIPDFYYLLQTQTTEDNKEPGFWQAKNISEGDSIYYCSSSHFISGLNSTYGANNVFDLTDSGSWSSRHVYDIYDHLGNYTGKTVTTVGNKLINGEWVSITAPSEFILKAYFLESFFPYCISWMIVGSNDNGNTNFVVDKQSPELNNATGFFKIRIDNNMTAYSTYRIIILSRIPHKSESGAVSISKWGLFK